MYWLISYGRAEVEKLRWFLSTSLPVGIDVQSYEDAADAAYRIPKKGETDGTMQPSRPFQSYEESWREVRVECKKPEE